MKVIKIITRYEIENSFETIGEATFGYRKPMAFQMTELGRKTTANYLDQLSLFSDFTRWNPLSWLILWFASAMLAGNFKGAELLKLHLDIVWQKLVSAYRNNKPISTAEVVEMMLMQRVVQGV